MAVAAKRSTSKSKAKAAGKAKGAAKTKSQAKPKAGGSPCPVDGAGSVKEQDLVLASASGASSSSSMQMPFAAAQPPPARRATRRDTDDAVDRAMDTRLLPHYSIGKLEGAVNSKGQRVRDRIAEQVRKNRPEKKKLTTQFWTELINAFHLVPETSGSGELPDPDPEDVHVREDLLERIGMAHADNPAGRSVEPLERYLERCEDLSYVELYGCIKASMEGPRVIRSASGRLLVAILKYIARSGAKDKFPEMWAAMASKFDEVLAENYEGFFSRGVPALNWLRVHRPLVQLYADPQDMQALATCLENEVSPPVAVLQRTIRASKVLAVMFAESAKRIDYENFLQLVSQRLKDLEFHEFIESEVRAFKGMMLMQTRAMSAAGRRCTNKTADAILFFGAEIFVARATLDDDWELRFHAKVKSLACNSGVLKLLPWESVLYGTGNVPNTSQTVRPPADLLAEYSNVREVVLRNLGMGPHTFADMRRVAAGSSKVWLGLDRSFSLELACLTEAAEKLAIDRIHTTTLGILPGEDGTKQFGSVMVQLQGLIASHLCIACVASVVAEVEGVRGLVAALDEGVGMDARGLTNMSQFYQAVVAKLQNFYIRAESGPKVGIFPRSLIGRLAVQDLYETVVAKAAVGQQFPIQELRPLRTYRWLLTAEQEKTSQAWIQEATATAAQHLTRMLLAPEVASKDESAVALVASSCSAGAASSSSAASAKKKAKTGSEAMVGGAAKKDLMQFFAGKK